MYFKSWPSFTNARSVETSNLDGLYSDLSTLSLHGRTSDGQTQSGKKTDSSGERLERASTRSRNSQSPSTNHTQISIRTDIFKAKYQELKLLDEGGYGKVFSGYREDDKLKVAIKHVSQETVERTPQVLSEKMSAVPVEVALLIKVGAGPESKSSSVTPALLDWFDLEDELILVFERPACSMNLVDYISSRQDKLAEEEVKTILAQLLDAAIEMHSRAVFHRDIKLENIIIERKAGVPRVRFLDFGCGTTYTPGQKFTGGIGTKEYTPPEWHERHCYMAVPTTVWQLGVVMYALLHRELPFTDASRIIRHNPLIRPELSHEGKHFLRNCLIKSPEDRPTLEKLRIHPG
ncbi:hypothetical protein Q5P01_013144 [Channa striata]|uniref:non-specific serine/threonine protein kinase n=1 Tax=Channa striata TaxID=64152 RepID=A0AA88MNM0_CHASR|nr:hypothetical protein Q5P01_013144 [Channa striata]